MVEFREKFESARPHLPGSKRIAGLRGAAFAQFETEGLPTRRNESWRYTDLGAIGQADFEFIVPRPSAAASEVSEQAAIAAGLDLEGTKIVVVDGHVLTPLQDRAGEPELLLSTLADRLSTSNSGTLLLDQVNDHPLALLNTAMTVDGLIIGVPDNAAISAPVHILFASSAGRSLATQPRIFIELGANSRLHVVLQFLTSAADEGWTNLVTQVTQAPGSQCDLLQLQEHSDGWIQTNLTLAKLARDATFTAGFIDLGAKLIRNDVEVHLAQPGAHAEIYGLSLAQRARHVDNHIQINHNAAGTSSRQEFTGIAGSKGKSVYNGKVVIKPNAQKTEARQQSRNLLLDQTAEIDTKPELEIYADDVKCSHGATVGELDEQQLFYLRSRGIDDAGARALLTFAFANRALRSVEDTTVRRAIGRRVGAQLPRHEYWEELL